MKKSQVTKVANAVGGGRRFLVIVVLGLGWLTWGSRTSLAQGYSFQTLPDENSGDPMGYTQAQIESETWWCATGGMGRVAPTSRVANINYVCPVGQPSSPYFPSDIINTPWASAVSTTNNCGSTYYGDAVTYLTLTLKAIVQPGYVFDHWEVVGSSMDLSDFTDVATPEATIELCELTNYSGGYNGDYQPAAGFDPNAQYRAVFKVASSPPTPTPTPAPAVTPPANNNDSNSNGGSSTTMPSAPQCHGNKPADPAPYITHATSGGAGSITLHYQLGGKPYTKYLVEYGYADAGFSFGATIDHPDTGSFTINDLSPGTTYQFRLIPANDCAAGTPSNTFPVAVGGLPKVPGTPNTGW